MRARATAGRAIALNALVLVAGFLLLFLVSSSPPNRRLGGLFALSMLVCWAATVTVLPALVAGPSCGRSSSASDPT